MDAKSVCSIFTTKKKFIIMFVFKIATTRTCNHEDEMCWLPLLMNEMVKIIINDRLIPCEL